MANWIAQFVALHCQTQHAIVARDADAKDECGIEAPRDEADLVGHGGAKGTLQGVFDKCSFVVGEKSCELFHYLELNCNSERVKHREYRGA